MKYGTYFDSAASTPVDPRVQSTMEAHAAIFGNNNSKHGRGYEAQKVIDTSLKIIADVLGCNWEQLSVTYSGTDANRRVLWACRKHFGIENLYCSAVEHSSILDEILPTHRFDPVTLQGLPGSSKLAALMGANSETGRVYSGSDIRSKFPESLILRDYSQSFAKGLEPDLESADFGVFTPQKFYGPKHIGILYMKSPELFPEISKDSHTKSCSLVAGAAKAFEIWHEEKEQHLEKLATWDDQIRQYIAQHIPGFKFHESEATKVRGLINVAFKEVRGGELMALLAKEEDICISIGSACTSDIMVPTEVISYIEKDPVWQYPIRMSLHKFLTDQDISDFCEILEHYVAEIRNR